MSEPVLVIGRLHQSKRQACVREAAEELLTALKYCRMVLYSCGEDTAGTPKGDFFRRAVKTCDSVIAKAEGQ